MGGGGATLAGPEGGAQPRPDARPASPRTSPGAGHKRGQPELSPGLKRLNRLIATERAKVEHPFAWIRQIGHRRARYLRRRRNELNLVLRLTAHNWKRSLSLAEHGSTVRLSVAGNAISPHHSGLNGPVQQMNWAFITAGDQ